MGALNPVRAALRRPGVQALVSMAAALLLLLAFHHTVAQAVHRAEARRHADTRLALAAWQCNTIHSSRERRGCLARLGLEESGPSAGCDAVTPDGSACAFGPTRRLPRAPTSNPTL